MEYYRVITRGFARSGLVEASRGKSKKYARSLAGKKAREGHYTEIQVGSILTPEEEKEWGDDAWETIWDSQAGWRSGW